MPIQAAGHTHPSSDLHRTSGHIQAAEAGAAHPEADDKPHDPNTHYVGFWLRGLANGADLILISAIVTPILVVIYGPGYLFDGELVEGGWHVVIGGILPAVAALTFLVKRQATPGKMIINAHIVCADTGAKPGLGKLIFRYLAFTVVTVLSAGLGCLWIAWDSRKQGWHDKIARTVVVIRPQKRGN